MPVSAKTFRIRTLGRLPVMPIHIHKEYSESQACPLVVIALDLYKNGICTLSNEDIAERCMLTKVSVRNTIKLAEQNGHIISKMSESEDGKNTRYIEFAKENIVNFVNNHERYMKEDINATLIHINEPWSRNSIIPLK